MRATTILTICLTVTLSFAGAASAQHNKQRGAAVGGIAGAIAGGLIGENNDEPLAGAAIGGAIGVVTGAVMGKAKDRDMEYARRQAAARARARAQAVTFQDVIQMTNAGLSDTVIANEVQRRGVQRRPNVSEIIMLHQRGVSEAVIGLLQSAAAPVRVVPARPVVVAPLYVPRPHYHRYHGPPRHARGRSFGF